MMRFKVSIAYLLCLPFLAGVAILVTAPPSQAQPMSIVGFGDSLMAGYQLPQPASFPARLEKALKAKGHDVTITNAGVSGDTTSDGLSRLDWSVPDGSDAVILELGGNDALRGISPEKTRANLDAMIRRLQDRHIEVLLVGILAPPNMGQAYSDAFDPIFSGLAKKYHLIYYPFFLDGVATHGNLQLGDGMHPNAKGTGVMTKRFLPYAVRLIESVQAADGK